MTYADTAVIDGAVNGLGSGTHKWGERLRTTQNGFLRSYSAVMAVGVVLILTIVLVARI
jgi:NADH-quinone oxidoreductase subunit L